MLCYVSVTDCLMGLFEGGSSSFSASQSLKGFIFYKYNVAIMLIQRVCFKNVYCLYSAHCFWFEILKYWFPSILKLTLILPTTKWFSFPVLYLEQQYDLNESPQMSHMRNSDIGSMNSMLVVGFHQPPQMASEPLYVLRYTARNNNMMDLTGGEVRGFLNNIIRQMGLIYFRQIWVKLLLQMPYLVYQGSYPQARLWRDPNLLKGFSANRRLTHLSVWLRTCQIRYFRCYTMKCQKFLCETKAI